MNQKDIGDAMRRLPRATASPRFTSDVIRALRAPRPVRRTWRIAAATAMVLIVLVASYAAAVVRQRQQRLANLRQERQQIESELRRVKALADESKPVVVLENGDTRLIVHREDSQARPALFYY